MRDIETIVITLREIQADYADDMRVNYLVEAMNYFIEATSPDEEELYKPTLFEIEEIYHILSEGFEEQ